MRMMNNFPRISIIVPVYNVDKYLDRCLNSILKQTYQNLEIILVDDGSTDNSPKLCDEYATKDNRIIVIHQENSGLASARNTGLENSTGDFVGFVDSDDWIELDTYNYCVGLINKFNSDIIEFQLGYAYNDEKFPFRNEKLIEYKGKEILQHYMYCTTTGKGGDYSVCVCLFKKELLEDVRFRTGKINEDIDFKYKVYSRASTLINTNIAKYYYFQQSESVSMGGLRRKDFDLYDAAEELMKLSRGEKYGNIRKLVEIKKARTPLSLLCKVAYFGIKDTSLDKSEVVTTLTKELRSNLKLLLFSQIPISRRLLALMFCINYRLTEVIIGFAKRKS